MSKKADLADTIGNLSQYLQDPSIRNALIGGGIGAIGGGIAGYGSNNALLGALLGGGLGAGGGYLGTQYGFLPDGKSMRSLLGNAQEPAKKEQGKGSWLGKALGVGAAGAGTLLAYKYLKNRGATKDIGKKLNALIPRGGNAVKDQIFDLKDQGKGVFASEKKAAIDSSDALVAGGTAGGMAGIMDLIQKNNLNRVIGNTEHELSWLGDLMKRNRLGTEGKHTYSLLNKVLSDLPYGLPRGAGKGLLGAGGAALLAGLALKARNGKPSEIKGASVKKKI